MTSNTGPILVFPRIQPLGSDDFSSFGKVYSRHVTGSVNCENSSVSTVRLVLCTFAIDLLAQDHQSKVHVFLSTNL